MKITHPLVALLLVILQSSSHVTARIRKGGGRGGGIDGPDIGGGGGGGGGPGGGPSGGGGGFGPGAWHKPPCNLGTCICKNVDARKRLYELPGIYYNGTLTVRHHVTSNTAWDREQDDLRSAKCNNRDGDPKTYHYPGLLFVGPTGNDSDTNQIHWALWGYRTGEETSGPSSQLPFIDVYQRHVSIRSSDFVVTEHGLYGPDQSRYRQSDPSGEYQQTRVYWDTNVTKTGIESFSASAEYKNTPPLRPLRSDFNEELYKGGGPHSSQYVTLSDVCDLDQQFMKHRGGGARSSPFTAGDDGDVFVHSTTPTVWLTLGATSSMEGIGTDTALFVMNNTIGKTVPFVSKGEAPSCYTTTSDSTNFDRTSFQALHFPPSDNWWDDKPRHPWNITVTVSLSFEGSIVRENSTVIESWDGDTPVFEYEYERAEREVENDEIEREPTSGASGGAWRGLEGVVVTVMGFVGFVVSAYLWI